MSALRIVFAGTPEFAAPSLSALIEYNRPVAVMTQPDRPAGRGRRMTTGPVKRLALEAGIDVLQPESLKPDDAASTIAALEPDLLVTAAYGLLLPRRILDVPRLGCWNLHASLLPRWRGASPIQQAILAGDSETGITLMQMDTGLDTGDMLMTSETPIGAEETAAELHDRLADMAATLLIAALQRLATGTLPPAQSQRDPLATRAPLIGKADAAIDWRLDAVTLERQVRAYNPCPVAHGEVEGQRLRIFRARAAKAGSEGHAPGSLVPGADPTDGIRIACGQGTLDLIELQAPGRKRVSAAQWLNAHPNWRR